MDNAELSLALNRLAPTLADGAVATAGDLRRLSGGASQETWAFRLVTDSGARELILRRRPNGFADRDEERTVSLATEAALIQATRDRGVPAPPIVRVCEPADDVGEAYIMGKVDGETLGRRIVRDASFAEVRSGLARRCGEVLAQIHATPLFGLPSLNRSGAQEELDRYRAIYRSTAAQRPVFELAFRKLADAAPEGQDDVLLHGDFRNGNLMIHPEHGLAAVLDWELAHVGHRASDLGWLCVNSWRFGNHVNPVGGFGPYKDLLDGYEAAGGQPITLDELKYWQMLGSLKWGVMCLIMYSAFASGADPSVERAMIGRRVSETEIDLINLMEGRS